MAFKIWEPQNDRFAYSNRCYNELFYKGTALYVYLVKLLYYKVGVKWEMFVNFFRDFILS